MPSVLLDTCVWGGVRAELSALGHDVNWSGDWECDPGDLAILETAFAESRILVTLDKDFGELAILKGMPHAGIIRMHGFRTSQMAGVIDHLIQRYQTELSSAAIITVTPQRVRIRLA